MGRSAYYDEENARWPLASAITLTEPQARATARRFGALLGIKPRVKFTDRSVSHAEISGLLVMSRVMLNPLDIAHEVAHLVEFRMCNFTPTRPYADSWKSHGIRHRLIVDLLMQHAKQEKWSYGEPSRLSR